MTASGEPMRRAAVSAPDESGFFSAESPAPAPVTEKGNSRSRRAGAVDGGSRAPTRWVRVWAALKLLAGLVVVIGTSLAVAWGAYRYALTTQRFAVQSIDVRGARRLSGSEIQRIAAIEPGQNIFALDTERAEAALIGNPWVKSVKITRQLPTMLRVELEEYEASAVAAIGQRLFLVTRSGDPFKELGESDPYDLPVLTGISAENLARDRDRELERIQTGLQILRYYEQLGTSRAFPPQEVHLGPSGDAVLTVGRQGLALHLGKGPWRQKLVMAESVMQRLQRQGRVPSTIFLDNEAHPERVVVRMQ